MSERDLDGQVAIVTGGSRGIGRAIALGLGQKGAHVVLTYVSDEAAAADAVKAIEAAGSKAVAVKADISDEAELRALFDRATEAFGRIDIVVNNAHKGSGRGLIAELPMAEFDQQAQVLRGFFVVMQEAARRVEDGGCIINISSGTTRMARPYNALYSGMKSAIEQFTRVLSKEIGHRGVNVNTVSPGLTATERVSDRPLTVPPTVPAGFPPTKFDRAGTPEEVAAAVCFLASPGGRWINSQNITANGGATWSA